MGRPAKKKPVEEHIETAMEVVAVADAMNFEELRDFPELANEPPRNQIIMACVAMGITQERIAREFGVTQGDISQIVTRIDPHKRMRASKDAKRGFITRLLEQKANSLLMSITEEDIDAMDPYKRINAAAKAMDTVAKMNQTKHKEVAVDSLDRLLARADADAGGAPYEEGSDDSPEG